MSPHQWVQSFTVPKPETGSILLAFCKAINKNVLKIVVKVADNKNVSSLPDSDIIIVISEQLYDHTRCKCLFRLTCYQYLYHYQTCYYQIQNTGFHIVLHLHNSDRSRTNIQCSYCPCVVNAS